MRLKPGAVFDKLNLLVDSLEELITNQLLHIELTYDNLDPGLGLLIIIVTCWLLPRDFKDKSANVEVIVALLASGS